MRFSGRRRIPVAIAIGTALVVASAAGATGGPSSDPVLVSGVDQLPEEGEPYHCGSVGAGQEWEQDNALAVDPTERDHLVAAWIQDYLDAITVAWSHDGGRTWSRTVPRAARCTWRQTPAPVRDGNSFELTNSANDPWVAIGPGLVGGSVAYVTSIVTQAVPAYATSAAVVNSSTDGGETWSDPVVLERASMAEGTLIDQTHVVAAASDPGRAYAVWTRFDTTSDPGRVNSQIRLSGTSDDGRTWSEPETVVVGPPARTPFGSQLAVLPDGGLVLTYPEGPAPTVDTLLTFSPPAGTYRQMVTRWHPLHQAWTEPRELAVISTESLNVGRMAMSPDGTLHVGWLRPGDGDSRLEYVTSRDGGLTWTAPAGAGATLPGDSEPTLAAFGAADNGRLAFTFYDHRNDPGTGSDGVQVTGSDGVQVTDLWARTSEGGTWRETHVAGPFNRFAAPYNGLGYGDCDNELVLFSTDGCYDDSERGDLGDHQGIVGLGSGFGVLSVLARDLPGANFTMPTTDGHGHPNGTDVFFARLRG